MKFLYVDECVSTNSSLAAMASECGHGTVLTARSQTAGRGQRGNSWEAAPGANITMSLLLRPKGLHPSRQFVISQAVSLAIVSVLERYLPTRSGRCMSIKWPNDIYYGDKKICGILIENSITSTGINHSIVGIGINVNQERFMSDAPNPVSMRQITGNCFPLNALVEEFCKEIVEKVDEVVGDMVGGGTEMLQRLGEQYFASLWRSDAFYPYRDNLRSEMIEARIRSVAPDGVITMTLDTGEERSYRFKEISAVVKRLFNNKYEAGVDVFLN